MPNIVIRVVKDAFPGNCKADLIKGLSDAAAAAEQIPDDPKNRVYSWIQIEELDPSSFACGGQDMSAQMLPCVALVYVPQGVLDDAHRFKYIRLVHDAISAARPANDPRPLATSVILQDVIDGTWGASGVQVRLPELTQFAGFKHLQHLVRD